MKRREFCVSGLTLAGLSACGGGSESVDNSGLSGPVTNQNRYMQANLAASNTSYKAKFVLPDMVAAWGVAIRPAGAGGHFWVGAGGSSWQFLGDVKNSPNPALQDFTVDALKRVNAAVGTNPLDGTRLGGTTGVAFNGAPIWAGSTAATKFAVSPSLANPAQTVNGVVMEGGARFMFVSDTGLLSAWTDRRADTGGTLREDGNAQLIYDGGTADGSAYFGVALKTDNFDTLWVVDFGASPQIRQFDSTWALVPTQGFDNPFGTGAAGAVKPGDFVPFNIIVLESRVFVCYAKSRVSETDVNAFFAGEEDSLSAEAEKLSGFAPDRGRLVEYDLSGKLVRIFKDEKHLNAPWGMAIAPSNFGQFSGALLVANFGGAGYITAFDSKTGQFLGYLRGPGGAFVAVAGVWGLVFGNGNSLGDLDALYFAAGPEGGEPAGLFGSLRYEPV